MPVKQDDVDTIAWIIGLLLLVMGAGFQWGWPAALITVGSVFAVWPLIKSAIKAIR